MLIGLGKSLSKVKLPESALPCVEFIIERFIAEFLTLFMLFSTFPEPPRSTSSIFVPSKFVEFFCNFLK